MNSLDYLNPVIVTERPAAAAEREGMDLDPDPDLPRLIPDPDLVPHALDAVMQGLVIWERNRLMQV